MEARLAPPARRALAILMACLLALSTCIPFAAPGSAAAAPADATVTVSPAQVTTETTSVTVSTSGCSSLAGGTLFVGTAPASTKFTSWVDTDDVTKIGQGQSFAGDGTYTFDIPSGKLAAGKQFVAYVYHYDVDADAIDVVYSTPVTITEAEPAAPTPAQILSGCSVEQIHDGEFTVSDTQTQVKVKLHSSLSQVHLTVFAYPTNSSFDPDSTANKRLWAGFVKDGETVTCDFGKAQLPLAPGYSVIASLNVPVAEDWYRPVNSQPIRVVDDQGQGVEPYVYPDAKITDSKLEAGDTKVHVSLTGDQRLFDYAKQGQTGIYISVGMYPDGEDFDFESPDYVSLYNGFDNTEPFSDHEITLREPLRAGWRVRAVAYWKQNTELFIPKGNDYEAAFNMPDDSVLVQTSSVVVKPAVSLGDVYTDSKELSAAISGTIPADTAVILRSYEAGASDFSLAGGTFVASSFGVQPGTESMAPAALSLFAGRQVVAFLVNSGEVLAQSAPVTVKASAQTGDESSIVVNAQQVTTDTTGVTVTVSGYPEYVGGHLFVGQGNVAGDADSATSPRLGSVTYTGPGTYSFAWDAGSLVAGKHLVVNLYQYDVENDRTSYAYADDVVVAAAAEPVDSDPDPDPEPTPDPDPDPEPVADPTIQLTTAKVTTGMTRMHVGYTFDDEQGAATISLYQFDGDELDPATATLISQTSQVYHPRKDDTISLGRGQIVAGKNLQAIIEVGGKTARSNVIAVQPAPGWGTPTIAIDAKALGKDATEIPLVVNYADEYLSMDDFYCNVTVYAYPDTYSDQDFEEQELNEKPDVARVVAFANNNSFGSSDQTRGTFSLAVRDSALPLKQGERLIAKLRLPHTEWEGEEQDFLSVSIPVADETVAPDPEQPADPDDPDDPADPTGPEQPVTPTDPENPGETTDDPEKEQSGEPVDDPEKAAGDEKASAASGSSAQQPGTSAGASNAAAGSASPKGPSSDAKQQSAQSGTTPKAGDALATSEVIALVLCAAAGAAAIALACSGRRRKGAHSK